MGQPHVEAVLGWVVIFVEVVRVVVSKVCGFLALGLVFVFVFCGELHGGRGAVFFVVFIIGFGLFFDVFAL